jgi:hypothetical protein
LFGLCLGFPFWPSSFVFFFLLQFTDMHFGETGDDDEMTQQVQRTVLAAEKPGSHTQAPTDRWPSVNDDDHLPVEFELLCADLVVLGGDHVSGYAWGRHGAKPGWFRAQYAKAVKVMQEKGIPWAMTIGNHDEEADLDRHGIAALDRSLEGSVTQATAPAADGATNYVLNIYAPQSSQQSLATSDEVMARIYFFDSHRDYCQGVRGWGCAQPNQVDWYRDHARVLEQQSAIKPAIGFIHIPLPEMLQMYNSLPTYGTLGEWDGVCCSSVNSGLYSAIKRAHEIKLLLRFVPPPLAFVVIHHSSALTRRVAHGTHTADMIIRTTSSDRWTECTWAMEGRLVMVAIFDGDGSVVRV